MVGARRRAAVGRPPLWVVAGRHRPPARPAEHDPLAQGQALPHQAGPLVGAVGRKPRLDGHILLPADVTLVVAVAHHGPLLARAQPHPGVHGAVRAHRPAGGVPAVDVGARIARVGQHPQRPGVRQPAPSQLPGPDPPIGPQREPPPNERGHHLERRAARGERGEDVPDGPLHLLIRVDHADTLVVVAVADRQRETQLAAFGRGPFRALQPARQQVQLTLGHTALQPEQEAVVDVREIVDTVGVHQQRIRQTGQLQQAGEVRRRAGQPGHLQPEDRPDLAQTHLGHQVAEALAVGTEPPGHPQERPEPVPVQFVNWRSSTAERIRQTEIEKALCWLFEVKRG